MSLSRVSKLQVTSFGGSDLLRKFWRGHATHVKSMLIVGYFLFVIWAAFGIMFRWPLAGYSYPWSSYSMFTFHEGTTIEFVATGVRNDDTVNLPLQEFFPMSKAWIARGGGVEVFNKFTVLPRPQRNREAMRLCKYFLASYNKNVYASQLRLSKVTLRARFKSLASPRNSFRVLREEVLATCS